RRLLYVALTRAGDRLYVCGTEKQVGERDKPRRWHATISAALQADWVESTDENGLVTCEWRPPQGVVPKAKGKQEAMAFAPPQPAWLSRPAPPAPAALRRISPSTAGAGIARVPLAPPRGDALLAAERGRLIHRMLQS